LYVPRSENPDLGHPKFVTSTLGATTKMHLVWGTYDPYMIYKFVLSGGYHGGPDSEAGLETGGSGEAPCHCRGVVREAEAAVGAK